MHVLLSSVNGEMKKFGFLRRNAVKRPAGL
jgi:hypothetical protein